MKKRIKIVTFAYGQGRRGWPPPLTVSLTVKYSFFYDSPQKTNWSWLSLHTRTHQIDQTRPVHTEPHHQETSLSFRLIHTSISTLDSLYTQTKFTHLATLDIWTIQKNYQDKCRIHIVYFVLLRQRHWSVQSHVTRIKDRFFIFIKDKVLLFRVTDWFHS